MSELTHNIEKYIYFPTAIYMANRPDLLSVVNQVSEENLSIVRTNERNDIFPVYMSENYYNDPRLEEFSKFIYNTAWDILKDQGYQMSNKETFFIEMWTQEHYKHSMMEQHTHKFGSQIIGFYFLETPENCSRLLIHDPRPANTIRGLDEINIEDATDASDVINFKPEPGMMVFTNGWLPHSFGRHASNDPIKFVHFNIGVRHAMITTSRDSDLPDAEVI